MTPSRARFLVLVAGALATLAFVRPAPLRAGLIDPPPGLVAMWEGKDGAAVRAALRRDAAEGERAGASAGKKLEAGEAAYWLGVQDARAGRTDSALVQWRRALRLRGEYDEGFALVDALFRRARAADVTEAYAVAAGLAQVAGLEMPRRAAEAHARLAWARHLRGNNDSALAEIREWCDALHARPLWTRRFAEIALAGGEPNRAWPWLALLSARTRQRDAGVESLLVRTQRTLRYSDEHRRLSVSIPADSIAEHERRIATSLGARFQDARARDGFPIRWLEIPAVAGAPRRAPLLFVLSGVDTLAAPDSLGAALAAAGHPVVLLAPRGSYGAIGKGTAGPEAWFGREGQLHPLVASDASQVMAILEKRGFTAGAGWLVGAAGDLAPAALELACAHKDVQALLLVAPKLPVVELAEFRARLRAAGTRTFVQVSPEEPESLELGDLLARFTNPGQVRVADSGLSGRGAAIFRAEPKVAERLIGWLAEKPPKSPR
jgi:hypothetical protein